MIKKRMEVKTFNVGLWIVCAIFVCYGVGLAEETVLRVRPKPRFRRGNYRVQGNEKKVPYEDRFKCVVFRGADKKMNWTQRSVESCVDYCWRDRQPMALFDSNEKCYCTKIHQLEYLESNVTACVGTCVTVELCDTIHITLYETGYVKEPVFNKYDSYQMYRLSSFECFQHSFDYMTLATARMTQSMCLEYCEYLGISMTFLTKGEYCGCIERMDNKGFIKLDKRLCNATCSGDKTMTCGGGDYKGGVLFDRYMSANSVPNDDRFKDLTWTKPAMKKVKDFYFFAKAE